jgi:hypothetical protein
MKSATQQTMIVVLKLGSKKYLQLNSLHNLKLCSAFPEQSFFIHPYLNLLYFLQVFLPLPVAHAPL